MIDHLLGAAVVVVVGDAKQWNSYVIVQRRETSMVLLTACHRKRDHSVVECVHHDQVTSWVDLHRVGRTHRGGSHCDTVTGSRIPTLNSGIGRIQNVQVTKWIHAHRCWTVQLVGIWASIAC